MYIYISHSSTCILKNRSQQRQLSLSLSFPLIDINSSPMASIQCPKLVEHKTMVCHETTTEACHGKGRQEHSFTDKIKEMAHSATKIFEHKSQESSGQHCHIKPHSSANHEAFAKNHAQQSAACHFPGTANAATAAHKKEGHGGNFIANIGEHIKNLTSKKKHRKHRGGNCNESGSDSSSSDDSDNETCEKKDCV